MDEQLRKLVNSIFEDHEKGGLDCESCSAQFNCLVELVIAGADMHRVLPAVEEHLRCCGECREEYDALLAVVRAELGGLTTLNNLSAQKDS